MTTQSLIFWRKCHTVSTVQADLEHAQSSCFRPPSYEITGPLISGSVDHLFEHVAYDG